jgi:hypothetical protein
MRLISVRQRKCLPGVSGIEFFQRGPMTNIVRNMPRWRNRLRQTRKQPTLPESGQPGRQNHSISDSDRRRTQSIVRMGTAGNAAWAVSANSRSITEHAHTVLHSSSIRNTLRTLPAGGVHVRLDATPGGSTGGVRCKISAVVHSALDVWRPQSNGDV